MDSMVVYRAFFHSMFVKDKSSFTATNSADPVEIPHSVVNDVAVSALAISELNGVGRHWERYRVIFDRRCVPLLNF